MRTTARRDGDAWVLRGSKQWITGGDAAAVIIVWARTGPIDAAARGISCFLVPRARPGLRVGKPEDKMGLRGSNTVALEFADCRVPADALLGRENEGFKVAMMALDGGRIGISSQAIGIARAALEESVRYAKERRAFGVPIGDHQAIQWKLADMQTEIDAAHLLSLRAAWLKEQRPALLARGVDGQALRQRGGRPRLQRRGADPRRIRLHARLRGRAPPARRAGDDDLRGHERDPAARHRADRARLNGPFC